MRSRPRVRIVSSCWTTPPRRRTARTSGGTTSQSSSIGRFDRRAVRLILGLLTQFVAFLFFLEMIATTIFSKTKLNKKFILGYELDVAYAAFALVLALLGPGGWSLDRILGLA